MLWSSDIVFNVYVVVYIVQYRFYEDGSNTNPVICVHVVCDHNNLCIFKSSTKDTEDRELSIAGSGNRLRSDSDCSVHYVEILHGCTSRQVDMNLKFTSYVGDNNLYLQVWCT